MEISLLPCLSDAVLSDGTYWVFSIAAKERDLLRRPENRSVANDLGGCGGGGHSSAHHAAWIVPLLFVWHACEVGPRPSAFYDAE